MILKAMTETEINKALSTIKKGAYTRVRYATDIPVKAEFKKKGVEIKKITETTVRFGINYEHIKKVMDKKAKADPTTPKRPAWFEWINPNFILFNKKTLDRYVRMTLTPNSNTKRSYLYQDEHGKVTRLDNLETIKDYILPSFFTPSDGEIPDIINVKLENVLNISS